MDFLKLEFAKELPTRAGFPFHRWTREHLSKASIDQRVLEAGLQRSDG